MSSKAYLIVVGTDFSEHAVRALHTAYDAALRYGSAELHVVHASLATNPADEYALPLVARVGALPVQTLEEQQAALVRHLDAQLATLPNFTQSGIRIIAHVVTDTPVIALTQLANKLEADLIVVGTHGRHGVARWLLGSVAEAVVRQASCPVLVVPPQPHELPVPAIAPPCPLCVAARQETHGAEQWCEHHRERHGRRHVYHQGDRAGADTNFPLVTR